MSIRSWIVFSAVAACIVVGIYVQAAPAKPLQNGSFNDVRGNLPAQWHLNEPVKNRGAASVEGDSRVLVLRPNAKNTEVSSAFGVVQILPADDYRGKSVPLSVSLRAEGGATASAMALVFDKKDKIVQAVQILSPESRMEQKSTSIAVPQDAKTVMIALSVTGSRGAAYFDDVTFEPGAEKPVTTTRGQTQTSGRRGARPTGRGTASETTEATASFGTVWTPVVDQPLRGGPCMSWRCVGVGDPTIARAPDGKLMLWFTTVGIRQEADQKFVADGPLFGRAVSQAGKVKPEFAYSPEEPVMKLGQIGDWDRHLETPSVRRDPKQPRWIMWYMGFKEKGGISGFKEPCIGQAFSTNAEGTQWTRSANPIYCAPSNGWDNLLITGPSGVLPGPDGTWRIYYSGIGMGNKGVGLLTSTDGQNWKPHSSNPVFKTPGDAWDSVVLEQTVVFAQGQYWMFYSGYKGTLTSSTVISIGMAVSDNGVNWTRKPDPVLRPGSSGSWNDLRIVAPDVIVDTDGSLLMAAYGKSKRDSQDSAGSIGFWRSQ